MVSGGLRLVSQIRLSYIKLNIVGAIARLTLRSPVYGGRKTSGRCRAAFRWLEGVLGRGGSNVLSQVHRCRKDNCAAGSTIGDSCVNVAVITTDPEPGLSLYT